MAHSASPPLGGCDRDEDMDFRGFELVGEEGERVAYRTYAVCPMCRAWAEFWGRYCDIVAP